MKKNVTYFIQNENGLILAVSRKDNHNDFGLPGGKVEPEDKSLEDAIAREVFEETGLTIWPFNLKLLFIQDGKEYTFTGDIFGTIKTDEKHIVKWATSQELLDGSFGEYNKKLFEHLKNKYGTKF